MNRVRIADIKMLCGNTAVHSDMVTWHPEESLEIAALQMTNTLFGVPQLSVMLQEIPEDHMEMIAFYTAYWNRHAHILMEGNFTAVRPLANYPMKKVIKNDHVIIGVYDTYVVPIDGAYREIHLLNSQLSSGIVLHCISDLGAYKAVIFNCRGNEVTTIQMTLSEGAVMIQVPACGMVQLTRSQ
jgi:alpha-galactosidase